MPTSFRAPNLFQSWMFDFNGTHAQVTIDQNFTIEEYVNNVLLGDGVTASNITLIGDPIQRGQNDTKQGTCPAEGIILATVIPIDFRLWPNNQGVGIRLRR